MSDLPQRDAPLAATRLLALAMVVSHLLLPLYGPWLSRSFAWELFTPTAVLLTLVLILCLQGETPPDLGFRPRPLQGWKYWFRLAVWFGLAIIAICAIALSLLWALGRFPAIPRASPAEAAARLFGYCLYAPVVEEIIYRALLTHALARVMGERGLIAISGCTFGLLHVLYGNPAPDNLVAGFFLQWSFLKSRTILVPMAMHAAGNAVALTSHLLNWSLLTPASAF